MKNLKKIKKVSILGKPFKITFCKERTGALCDEDNKRRYYVGRSDTEEQRITIAKHLALEEMFETIFHEVFHAIEYYLQYDSEEAYVQRMSVGLAAFLLDNFKVTLKQETL